MKYIYVFIILFAFGCKNFSSKEIGNELYEIDMREIPKSGSLIAEASYLRFKDSVHNILDDAIIIESFDNYSDLPKVFFSSFKTRKKVLFEGVESGFFEKKKVDITLSNGYEKGSLVNVLTLFENEEFKSKAKKYMQTNNRKAYRVTIIMKVKITLTISSLFKTTQKTAFFNIKYPGQLELPANYKEI
jgi:hypothetical protein